MTDSELQKKLKHKESYRFLVANPPVEITKRLQGINFALYPDAKRYAMAMFFVCNQAEIIDIVGNAIESSNEDGILCFAYAQTTVEIKSDINRDNGWGFRRQKGFRPVSQIAINGT